MLVAMGEHCVSLAVCYVLDVSLSHPHFRDARSAPATLRTMTR